MNVIMHSQLITLYSEWNISISLLYLFPSQHFVPGQRSNLTGIPKHSSQRSGISSPADHRYRPSHTGPSLQSEPVARTCIMFLGQGKWHLQEIYRYSITYHSSLNGPMLNKENSSKQDGNHEPECSHVILRWTGHNQITVHLSLDWSS